MKADHAPEYYEIIRCLVLPIPANAEPLAIAELARLSAEWDLEERDFLTFIQLEIDRWEQFESPSDQLAKTIRSVLTAALDDSRQIVAIKYFELYNIARDKPDHFEHLPARYLLAHLHLMISLATEEAMSASQISRVIQARDERIHCSWTLIQRLLQKIGSYNSLCLKKFRLLFEQDRHYSDHYLGDYSLEDAIIQLDETASRLGFHGNLQALLTVIIRPAEKPVCSMMEILLYQSSLAEFFDHALTYCYEYSPRGDAVKWMHRQFPDALVTGKEPFLDVAKSVYRISEEWALPKKNSEEALALARILTGLEQLGFAARKQLCAGIRYLVHRVITLHEGTEVWLPESVSKQQIKKILAGVASSPTGSQGIIEQRVLDAFEASLHPAEDGWRISAIDESVNATNKSGMKFGDCEFINPKESLVHAYEAHAGSLKDIYVEAHLHTLDAVCKKRIPLLEQQFDIDRLNCRITFVAQQLALEKLRSKVRRVVDGVTFELKFTTYEKVFVQSNWPKGLHEAFNQHVVRVMNNERHPLTPQTARDVFLKML